MLTTSRTSQTTNASRGSLGEVGKALFDSGREFETAVLEFLKWAATGGGCGDQELEFSQS